MEITKMNINTLAAYLLLKNERVEHGDKHEALIFFLQRNEFKKHHTKVTCETAFSLMTTITTYLICMFR